MSFAKKNFMPHPGKVVNGVPADEGEYPYVAAILANGFHFCGGSLITPSVVLTAAHCFEDLAVRNNQVNLLGNTIEVALGCNDIVNDDCEIIEVVSASLHPQYSLFQSVLGGNDLCLLELAEPSSQTTAQIPSPNVGQNAFTDFPSFEIGWGNELPVQDEFVGSEDLKEADSLVLDNDICEEQNDILFELAFQVTNTIDDTMICSVGDAKSVCQGDSGGPLLIQCDGAEEDLVIGVTSFGLGCGVPGHPNVFARTFNQDGFDFITQFVTAVGENNQLSVVDNFSNFCQDAEVIANENPTPFPTIDASLWTCPGEFYSGQDGCDCDCGLPDPDCVFDDNVFGCRPLQTCSDEGTCEGNTLEIIIASVTVVCLVCCACFILAVCLGIGCLSSMNKKSQVLEEKK